MDKLKEKLEQISPFLNEKQRRIVYAAEANQIGRGGKSQICLLTNMSRSTLNQGMKDLQADPDPSGSERIRKKGAGRKKQTDDQPQLKGALESLVEPLTSGDPESALRWTLKSSRTLAGELTAQGFKVGKTTVTNLLSELGYSLQSNRKGLEGESHPDRNAQFEFINKRAETYVSKNLPVISVDTKKKENIGNFKNLGQEYRPKKNGRKVNGHDFADEKASPYGIYDIVQNEGFVNIGKNYDTSQFAVNSIGQWWELVGKTHYPGAKNILITADSGGSNGYRRRQWKYELQRLANESGLVISVCHFPPGTSKWNKIEHKLFSQISLNWKGIPLVDYQTVVQLIGATKNTKGLTIKCQLDSTEYQKGIKITEEEMNRINLKKYKFHGEWNYVIKPNEM
jgi:transposase